jgi:beta-glucosidase-like glycosyl hydrolase
MSQRSLTLLLVMLVGMECTAQARCVDTLSSQGNLGIPLRQAAQLESRLGQLLVVNVDGFGYSGSLALSPAYADLVRSLQIGGVIPHYGSTDYERIRRTNKALREMTDQPLLVCCDIVKLAGRASTGSFGDGYVGGFLGRFRALPDAAFGTLAGLNAFAFAGIGVNVSLGPTVDTSTGDARTAERARLAIAAMRRFGLQPVIKHFPFLPTTANLHRASPDTALPLEDAARSFSIFKDLAREADVMMTTHLYDSAVDRSLVTFSKTWNTILRSRTGFRGLLMSDGLLMLANYADTSMLGGGPTGADVAGIDGTAVWALRAILAGHDLVIVEGSAAQTIRVFRGLLTVACGKSELGKTLRARIDESYARVTRWKKDRRKELRRLVDVPAATVQDVIALLPGESADLSRFSFDTAVLARLEPVMKAAAK